MFMLGEKILIVDNFKCLSPQQQFPALYVLFKIVPTTFCCFQNLLIEKSFDGKSGHSLIHNQAMKEKGFTSQTSAVICDVNLVSNPFPFIARL